MCKFEVNILGCGSATPTIQHNPSSQIIDLRDKLFMIDCGEGTQLQFRKQRLRFGRLNHIFISHLHGDHCFGLIGLISTLSLLGRTGDIVIHAHSDLETLLRPQINYFSRDMPCKLIIEPFNPVKSELIFEDRTVSVKTIPLKHRVPCAGFLFEEKQREPNLISEMIKAYDIPIKELVKIKQGADFITADGRLIPNGRLVAPAPAAKRYAYCSDTEYKEDIVPLIEGVDLLYHEATFADVEAYRCKPTGHSTAKQAATIAKMGNVKKLMLGHFSARYKSNQVLLTEAKQIFSNTILANEGICEKL